MMTTNNLSKRDLVEMANANQAIMDGTMAPIRALIAAHDVVVAVWQDSTEPDGVGAVVVKGTNLMREIIASGASQQRRVTAIASTDHAQAEALRRVMAADPLH